MALLSRWIVVLLVIVVSGVETAQARDISPVEIVPKSVVSVLPIWPGKAPNAERPEGSGVVVGDGRTVVTAAHVIGSGQRVAEKILVRDHDGNKQWSKVLAYDLRIDLAVLSVETPLVAARWAQDAPALGEQVCAIGNAFGLGLSVTCGHVSALHKAGVGFNPIEDFIQTDAAVNPGMSGGALVNRKGELGGILSAIFTKQADANIGVNFAVDARLVRQFIDAQMKAGSFKLFNPGLAMRKVPKSGAPGREGVEAIKVFVGLSGAKAGVQEGDIIYEAAGRRIRSKADWVSVLASSASANKLDVSGERNGKAMQWDLKN
jgi:S1-C subfamily serine protease